MDILGLGLGLDHASGAICNSCIRCIYVCMYVCMCLCICMCVCVCLCVCVCEWSRGKFVPAFTAESFEYFLSCLDFGNPNVAAISSSFEAQI